MDGIGSGPVLQRGQFRALLACAVIVCVWTARLSRGVLTITLKSPQSKVSVAIDDPALTVSSSLASKVKRHKVSKVTFRFAVTDSVHVRTKLSSKDRIS